MRFVFFINISLAVLFNLKLTTAASHHQKTKLLNKTVSLTLHYYLFLPLMPSSQHMHFITTETLKLVKCWAAARPAYIHPLSHQQTSLESACTLSFYFSSLAFLICHVNQRECHPQIATVSSFIFAIVSYIFWWCSTASSLSLFCRLFTTTSSRQYTSFLSYFWKVSFRN